MPNQEPKKSYKFFAPKVFIRTFGCQMNVYDSQKIMGLLAQRGFLPADSMDDADVILFNTCSVRQHAEERVFGKVNELKELKKKRPSLVIGVVGCMAQRYKRELFNILPHIDLVCGTGNLFEIGYLIEDAIAKRQAVAAVDKLEREIDSLPIIRDDPYSAFVTIMEGCQNFCSYCIVPFVRGQERSRKSVEVLNEVKRLVEAGYKEVTLLGQNVNSYGRHMAPAVEVKIEGPKGLDLEDIDAAIEGTGRKGKILHKGGRRKPIVLDKQAPQRIDFTKLLRLIDKTGIRRIRFITNHPKDTGERLFKAMSRLKGVCGHIHMPLQSGSDKILDLMNRKYKFLDYLKKIETLRKIIPDVAITTDIIVGFPSETERDFKKTYDAMKEIEFDSAFIFKYSPRPPAKAWELLDNVPTSVKEERLSMLLKLQDEISLKKNSSLIGKTLEVLVAGPSRKGKGQLMGRTRTNKIAVFRGPKNLIGTFVDVEIITVTAYTLKGRLVKNAKKK